MRWFLLGTVFMAALIAAAAALSLRFANGFSAREQPSAWERRLASAALSGAMPAHAKALKNPISSGAEALAEARAHWADHCAACHANDGSGEIEMGQHMYPPPPDMRLPATQNKSDGELFYIIKNGVRLTGMPAWGNSAADDEGSWKLVHFIRHLPAMAFEETKEMQRLNPKSADERTEEEAVEKFLRGDAVDETTQHHHH
jgi:mono/diheme cytochrome c family protein